VGQPAEAKAMQQGEQVADLAAVARSEKSIAGAKAQVSASDNALTQSLGLPLGLLIGTGPGRPAGC
jgi:hypothetical protein